MRSRLTPRAVSHSPVPGRGSGLDILPGKLSGGEGPQQVQVAVLHSSTQQERPDLRQGFLREEQEYRRAPQSNWQLLAIFCNRLAIAV